MEASNRGRIAGTALLLLQGLVTAVRPQLSVRVTREMLGKSFENASELEPRPRYLRGLRAVGVGLVAAAGTGLLLEGRDETDGSRDERGPRER